MIKAKKGYLASFITTLLAVGLMTQIYAVSPDNFDSNINKAIDNSNITAIMTVNDTGEQIILDAKPIQVTKRSGDSFTVGYEVFAPIGSKLRTSEGSDISDSGATARVSVDYTISSNGEQMRVNKLSGSWKGSNSLYYFSDRLCGVSSGGYWGAKSMEKRPTSDTFSYTTGWGYTDRISGDIGAHAWSEAVGWIAGMENSGGITLNIQFSFGGL